MTIMIPQIDTLQNSRTIDLLGPANRIPFLFQCGWHVVDKVSGPYFLLLKFRLILRTYEQSGYILALSTWTPFQSAP